MLKQLSSTTPVLSYPDFYVEFILDTDASNHGIVAVSSQEQDSGVNPNVEFVKHFRHYPQSSNFRIRTDHAPLRSVLKAKEPERQLAR